MAGGSLLTQGLESLGGHSRAIRSKLTELYALDDELQASHQKAKQDDDFGEEVVIKYKAFLACRQQLIAELERQKIPVPWQLRMTIDDIELTLKQRREKEGAATKSKSSKKKHQEKRDVTPTVEAAPTAQSGRVAVAFLGPTLISLIIAMLWYHWYIAVSV